MGPEVFPLRSGGTTGHGWRGSGCQYSLVPMQEYMDWTLHETFVIVQVEDKESLDIIEDVAQMDGLDGLFFGPGDMSQSLGIPCQFDHPQMEEVRNKRQEYQTMFENFDQKANQLFNILSTVMKSIKEMRSAVARNIL